MRRKRVIYFLFGLFFIGGTSLAQEIEQLAVFSGNFDYTAFGNTMNTTENGGGTPCEVLTESTATLTLEADQSIIAAYLYWAGSGPGDFDVQLNGVPITAERTFADQLDDTRIFFAAYAEVTTELQTTGAGEYTLSDLDVTAFIISDPVICGSGTNFAGWAITVIIEDPDLPINQVNVFDGLESVSQNNTQLDIELENLNVIDNEGARIGFVAWEGDATLAVNETLAVNGNIISNPPLNPVDNQFNSTNSFTESVVLYNMDIDVYDIENNINIGDSSATISLTSGQDFVMINNIITVLNSTLPDAIISLDAAAPVACLSRDVLVEYTVTNQGTEALPANTPIAFYADGVLAGNDATVASIMPGASESGNTIITIPAGVPEDFELLLIVDDTGGGNGIISELNEDNNESQPLDVNLNTIVIASPPMDLIVCDDLSNDGIEIFDLTINEDLVLGGQGDIIVAYFLTEADAQNNTNTIANPESYTNSENPQTIYMRLELIVDPDCILILSFTIRVVPQPAIGILDDIVVCDDESNDTFAIFDLTTLNGDIQGDFENVEISFFETETDALANTNSISNPTAYENITNPQTIYVRLESTEALNCFDISSFQIFVEDVAVIAGDLLDFLICDDPTNDDTAIFDLTINEDIAIGNQTGVLVNFYLNEADANDGINAITDPSNYQNISNPQIIYVRIQENDDDLCFSIDTFTLELFDQPIIPELDDIALCDDASNDGLLVFDLTIQESVILTGQGSFIITYHTSFEDAQNDNNAIQDPSNFENSQTNEGIFIRLENPFNTDCFDIGNFEINVLTIAPPQELPELLLCNEGFEMAVFDLSLGLEDLVLLDGEVVTGYYLNTEDAFNEQNAITDPFAYTNLSNPQTIYIRTDTSDDEVCYNLARLELRVENCPPFIPDGFSPNQDTFNQTFEISGLKDIFVDYELLIYSRLGNLIYRGDNEIPFWDGIPNEGIGGSEAPTGTYFYVLKLNDPDFDDFLGWVYLNR